MIIYFHNAFYSLKKFFIIYFFYICFIFIYSLILFNTKNIIPNYENEFLGLVIFPGKCCNTLLLFLLLWIFIIVLITYSVYTFECFYEFSNILLRIKKTSFYLYKCSVILLIVSLIKFLSVLFLLILYKKFLFIPFSYLLFGFVYSILISSITIFFTNIFSNKYKSLLVLLSLLCSYLAYLFLNIYVICIASLFLLIINYFVFSPKRLSNSR